MPASNIGTYLQDARNNFDAVRPALLSTDANQPMNQCQNMHISTNCYYGYHHLKIPHNNHVDTDCEMVELEVHRGRNDKSSKTTSKKRSAEEDEYPQKKRLREEGMVPSTSNYNPCILRPTHNNPDISRCLMVHMI